MHAVIFDIDGTLLDSTAVDDEIFHGALHHVLGPIKFRDSLAEYEFVSDSGILQQVIVDSDLLHLPDPTDKVIAAFVDGLSEHFSANGAFPEIPGARSFLASLQSSQDHYVAIATGGWSASARLKLETAEFDLDDIHVSTADVNPDRTEIMRAALDRPEQEYNSITYYGDGIWDRDACEKLGWDFVPVGPKLGGLDSYQHLIDT